MTKSIEHTLQTRSLEAGIISIKKALKTLPLHPGVYQMSNAKGRILYIGKAKFLKKRVTAYTHINKLPHRLQRMVSETRHLEIVITQNEAEALLLENQLIKKHQPSYNILLKDDKSFPYLLLTQDHPYPRLVKHRGAQNIKGFYFGPFPSGPAMDDMIVNILKIFRIRNCTDTFFARRTRPCLQYHIKRCTAPCVQYISQEEYQKMVQQALLFLKGNDSAVHQYLMEKMHYASENLEFEEAAQLRDQIRYLTKMHSHQRVHLKSIENADVIAIAELARKTCIQVFFYRNKQNYGGEHFFIPHTSDTSRQERLAAFIGQFYMAHEPPSHILLNEELEDRSLFISALRQRFKRRISLEVPRRGEKKSLVAHAFNNAQDRLKRQMQESSTHKKLLKKLADLLNLPTPPERIEVYDNSHIQGKFPYGVMVVIGPEGFEKAQYRKFTIKTTPLQMRGGDDYAMMREVLTRRLKRTQESWSLPDLIIIDGGKGHLQVGVDVLAQFPQEKSIQLLAIAQGPERNSGKEVIYRPDYPPLDLPHDHPVRYFLQRMRDEAHRFAIGTHRRGRTQGLVKSQLDGIPGIGATRKKALLARFGSVQNISAASIADLCQTEGIHQGLAEKIYAYFHEQSP